MPHNINWYAGLVRELEIDFKARNDLFEKIDDMVRPTWSLPKDFIDRIKNVMAIVDTAPSDAINSGAIAFSGSNPVFSVSPFAPNIAEYDRAQALEDALGFHFERAGRRGGGTFMYDIADSSLRYNTICVRVDDLAYIFPRRQSLWTAAQKRAWTAGRFIHKAVNPKNVYYAESDLGLEVVAHVETYRVLDAIKYWEAYANSNTEEGKMIEAALKILKDDIGYSDTRQSADRLRDMYFMQAYVIDDERLMIWGNIVGNISSNDGTSPGLIGQPRYILADQDNSYGFINWSIRVAGSRLESKMEYRVNPVLAPLHWSGMWDKLNLAKSMIYSEPIRRAQSPRMATFTDNGEAPEIDYENGGDINLRRGEDVKGLQPITLDQGAMAIVNQLEAAENRTTGASVIGDATQVSTRTSFAVYSAMVKVALSRLDKQREIMARSCEDVACLDLWWVDKTDVPLSAYAQADKEYRSGAFLPRGTKIEITRTDYNLQSLGISAIVKAATPVDEMEQLNKAVIMSTKLNYPVSKLLEEMGYKNVGLSYELWAREFVRNAELQAQAAQMLAEAQGAGQLAVQQQAQEQQQQQGEPGMLGAEQGLSNQSFGALGDLGQGVNPAMQGMAPAQAAPTMTREALTRRNFATRR